MKKLNHRRLAEGEVTGHFHEIQDESATLHEDGDLIQLDTPNGGKITHQEHNTITIPPGQYERSIVKEYDHQEEESRRVVD